jgi:SAM-dependent methyltransferase
MSPDYAKRLNDERAAYAEKTEVHDLPPICFYWLNRYILPQLEELGYSGADDFFLQNLRETMARGGGPYRFLSIGSGNCDTEIRLAAALRAGGVGEFAIECLDLNERMLERGMADAAAQELAAQIQPLCADFNAWRPEREYDAVIANQALHHVANLESLMDGVREALRPEGSFLVSDMIGRNGHRRWPEALAWVEQFWTELPDRYRYNRQLRRQETEYPDWDCSAEGFEGIRSQDILPLLLERFGFRFFYAFSNVMDPFIDRSFGPNFDPDSAIDRAFIDRVHGTDEREILAGRIKPTHMLAVLSRERGGKTKCFRRLTPEFCVRR